MSNNKPKGINQTDRKMSKKFEWELMEEFIQINKCMKNAKFINN